MPSQVRAQTDPCDAPDAKCITFITQEEVADPCADIIAMATKTIQQQGHLISLQSDQIEALRFNYDVVNQELDSKNNWYSQAPLVVGLAFVGGMLAAGYLLKK